MNCIKSTWNGFERLDFEFEERNATLVCPESATPDKKWLYKIEYFDAFSSFEIEMLKKGYFVELRTNKTFGRSFVYINSSIDSMTKS